MKKPAAPLVTFTPGILLWEKLRCGDPPSSPEKDMKGLLAFLRKARKPKGLSSKTWARFVAFLKPPGQDFPDFVRRFEWSTGAEASEGLNAQVRELIIARDPGLTTKDAELKYEQLFGYVIRLLARAPERGPRTLTREELERQLAKRAPDPSLVKFLTEFRETRDVLSRQLSAISTDVTEVKENTRAILAALTQKKGGPPLERVVDPAAVVDCFGAASQFLISWPQETNGRWIERPALQELEKLLDASVPGMMVLLGEPGSGKSALLARLAGRVRDSGAALLALKIDRLPRTVRSLRDLDQEWFRNVGFCRWCASNRAKETCDRAHRSIGRALLAHRPAVKPA